MEAYRSGHNEAVLKTVWVQAHGGSNPSASAKETRMQSRIRFSFFWGKGICEGFERERQENDGHPSFLAMTEALSRALTNTSTFDLRNARTNLSFTIQSKQR